MCSLSLGHAAHCSRGRLYQGLQVHPYFTTRKEMALQLPHLVSHFQDMWLKRLRAPA